MKNPLFPDIYVNSIYELPLDELEKKGIKALAFDIDNTISPYDVAQPDEKAQSFFKYLKERGFKAILLSNNNKKRISIFNGRQLGYH